MTFIRGVDPLTGLPQHLKVSSGDPGDPNNPAVMERSDPEVHSRLNLVISNLIEIDSSVDLVKTAIDNNKASVDLVKTAIDNNKASVDLVKTAIDNNKASVDLVKTEATAIKTSVANIESWETLLFDNFVTSQASRIVKTSQAYLRSFYVRNKSSSTTYYLMFFNQTTVPGAGAAPGVIGPIVIDPGIRLALGSNEFGDRGVSFSTGLVYGISTTDDTYTAATTPTDIRMFVGYR